VRGDSALFVTESLGELGCSLFFVAEQLGSSAECG
jgi:hypothetical protein